jgi:mannose/fructose/N-acetylgalactosamine-specific phosphotransferase system component IIC
MSIELMGTLLIAGMAAVDTVPIGQWMLSQPLVTAALLGWLWHDIGVALAAGAVLQVLAAATLPLGARTPEDYAAGGVIGVSLALAASSGHPFATTQNAALLLGVVAGMLAALGGIPLMRWQRRRTEGLARWCEERLAAGDEGAALRASWAGVAVAFGVGVVYCALWLAIGVPLLGGWVHGESLRLARAWTMAQPLWMGFGIAQLLHSFLRHRPRRALLFAVALMGGWLVRILEVL